MYAKHVQNDAKLCTYYANIMYRMMQNYVHIMQILYTDWCKNMYRLVPKICIYWCKKYVQIGARIIYRLMQKYVQIDENIMYRLMQKICTD